MQDYDTDTTYEGCYTYAPSQALTQRHHSQAEAIYEVLALDPLYEKNRTVIKECMKLDYKILMMEVTLFLIYVALLVGSRMLLSVSPSMVVLLRVLRILSVVSVSVLFVQEQRIHRLLRVLKMKKGFMKRYE